MPLLKTEDIAPDTRLAVWQISETIDELKACCLPSAAVNEKLAGIKNIHRQKEILAVRTLLQLLTNDKNPMIRHDEYGRPVMEGFHLSISHTKGYACVILSKSKRVAVDIEWRSDRVEKITHKFIRTDEHAPTTQHKLVNWCCKEVCYKYFYDRQLHYDDMRVSFPTPDDMTTVVVENLKDGVQISVHCLHTPYYVIVYTS